MTMETKIEIFRTKLSEYLKANKQDKTKILDHVVGVTEMHRKAIIRAFKRLQKKDPWKKSDCKSGRHVIYTPDVTVALKDLWDISRQLCAERLHPVITDYLEPLIRDGDWHHPDDVTYKLQAMSLGTMKRRIKKFQKAMIGGGRSTTKPSNLKELIPIRRDIWDNPKPGYGEIDTVVHCGHTLSGDMAYSVNFVDIRTFWNETYAQINKGQTRTKQSIVSIRERLPFDMLGLDPDSGSEFINFVLYDWCKEQGIELSRSRPNHKNDNAHIEQKNYTTVRNVFGYSRIDTQEAVDLMNQLYTGPWRLYVNFFQPSMKCLEKFRIGSRYRRKYDTPQTPYHRIMSLSDIPKKVKDDLSVQYARLNPLRLKRQIDSLVKQIFQIQKRLRNPSDLS